MGTIVLPAVRSSQRSSSTAKFSNKYSTLLAPTVCLQDYTARPSLKRCPGKDGDMSHSTSLLPIPPPSEISEQLFPSLPNNGAITSGEPATSRTPSHAFQWQRRMD